MENSFSFTVFIKTRNLNSLLVWAHKVLFINKDDFQSVLHGSTDLAKKWHGLADLHTPIHSPLETFQFLLTPNSFAKIWLLRPPPLWNFQNPLGWVWISSGTTHIYAKH